MAINIVKTQAIDNWTPLEAEREAQRLADAGQWQELAEFLSPNLGPKARPRTLLLATIAATETHTRKLLDGVIDLTVGSDLPPHIVLAIARRLAMAGETSAAWGVLLADKQLTASESSIPAVIGILSLIVQFSKDRNLRLGAIALKRRLSGVKTPVQPDQKITWGAEHPPADLACPTNPVLLFNQSVAAPAVVAELQEVRTAFESSLSREVPPQIAIYDNVLVNRYGQVWRDDGRVIISSKHPIPPESLAASRSAASVEHAMLAMEDAGFYHWLCEWMPSLFWSVYQGKDGPTFLMSDKPAGYQAASLDLLTTAIPRHAAGDAIRVKRLYVGDRRPLTYRYREAYAEGFRRINKAALDQAPTRTPANIYLSRRDASRRPIKNELDLIESLERVNFTAVELSRLTMAEQVALFANAQNIIAPHGAGLSHLLAKEQPARVLEIFPMSAGSMSLRYNFARISRLRGHTHGLHLERINPSTNEWAVNVDAVIREAGRFFA
ncbi:DUF563 domain-containing protein [Pseudoroseomonas wenyumeiae]|uniref:DUF563 domain-containing protein n=1 Tax=Teichococcus wenyumeiae TaxID=2478470 RepID=A0A3A9JDR2_9PROT|nr:glycosyltransferase family 61 protein [Pseudoroseomonas wenyumeiae]RKK02705.1 glycosyltransferase family 61 protein [Pseudoroseomonas wenyumeiae]RMI27017.1 DUF563 domain-containing protein [Pseudoroseomonas wenyumeiae]